MVQKINKETLIVGLFIILSSFLANIYVLDAVSIDNCSTVDSIITRLKVSAFLFIICGGLLYGSVEGYIPPLLFIVGMLLPFPLFASTYFSMSKCGVKISTYTTIALIICSASFIYAIVAWFLMFRGVFKNQNTRRSRSPSSVSSASFMSAESSFEPRSRSTTASSDSTLIPRSRSPSSASSSSLATIVPSGI